ncbi:MAG: hypothetical protein K6G15_00880 [Desulfovibrio sp.]|nr:hypothetical protein [Desulfovibrio sp.]
MPKDLPSQAADISGLPQPSRVTPKKLIVAALLACIVAACLVFYVTRPQEVQEQLRQDASNLREEAAKLVDDATRGTPLAGSGDLLREPPPPPPAAVLHPSTNPGTLAGPVIRGPSGIEGMLMPDGSFRQEGQKVVGRVEEDGRLKKDFVEDLAAFIVRRYQPDAKGGRLALSVQSVNQHCGTRMNTEAGGGRTALMRYAFQPTMLRGLYQLYVQDFLQKLALYAKERNLDGHLPLLYQQLAQKCTSVANAVEAILKTPDIEKQLADYERMAESCENISAQITGTLFDADQLAENGAQASELRAAQLRVSGLNAKLRRALENRDNALRHLLLALRKARDPLLDDETLLFLILWVQRRIATGGAAREAVQTSVDILRDLSGRLLRLGEAPTLAEAATTPEKTSNNEPKGNDEPRANDEPKANAPKQPAMARAGATLVEDRELQGKTEPEPAAPQEAPMPTPEPEAPLKAEAKTESPAKPVGSLDDGLPQPIQIPILAPHAAREGLL